jgi:hydrogenase maturation protease
MNPVSVLRMARAMNIELKNILLVGCEPQSLGGEEGHMGLSAPVEAAVEDAVKLVKSLIDRVTTDKVREKAQDKVHDKAGQISPQ